jgi:hypothetical protein
MAILLAVLKAGHMINYAVAVESTEFFPVNAIAVRPQTVVLQAALPAVTLDKLKIVAEANLATVVSIAVSFERIKLTMICSRQQMLLKA